MKGGSNIVSAIIAIKQAYDHFTSFQTEHKGSKGANLFKSYNGKLEWIYTDLKTNPFLSQAVRDGIKHEWESDVFCLDAISEKVALLSPEQKEIIELLVDEMIKGEIINIVNTPNGTNNNINSDLQHY